MNKDLQMAVYENFLSLSFSVTIM